MTNLKPTLLIVILDRDCPVTSCMDALKCQFDC